MVDRPLIDPRVSAVVVRYNALSETLACLASLTDPANQPVGGMEVIVVDNASPEGGLNRLQEDFPQVEVIANQANLGFAKAVNQGAARARGDYIFLVNPDCFLTERAVQDLVDWLEANPEAGLVGPRLINHDRSLQTSTYRFPTLTQSAANLFLFKKLIPVAAVRRLSPVWLADRFGQFRSHDRPERVDYCTGAALLIRRSVWQILQGLDEDFFLYYEEKDLCLRAAELGWATWFNPTAVVGHHIGASSETVPEIAVLARYRSMMVYFAKHQPNRLNKLRMLVKVGALFRRSLARMRGRAAEAEVWCRVFSLANRFRSGEIV